MEPDKAFFEINKEAYLIHKLFPWEKVSVQDVFALEDGDRGTLLFCFPLVDRNPEGQLQTILMIEGLSALRRFLEIGRMDDAREIWKECSSHILSYFPAGAVSRMERWRMRLSGLVPKGSPVFALLAVKNPDEEPGPPSDGEIAKLLPLLRGLRISLEKGEFKFGEAVPGMGIFTVSVSGTVEDPAVRCSEPNLWERIKPEAVFTPPDLEKLRKLKKGREAWLVDFNPAIDEEVEMVEGDGWELMIFHEPTNRFLRQERFDGPNRLGAAEALFEAFAGKNASGSRRLPAEAVFDDYLFMLTVRDALSQLGVRCVFDECGFAEGGPEEDEEDDEEEEDGEDLFLPAGFQPAPDDHEGWRQAMSSVDGKLAKAARLGALLTPGVAAKFFRNAACAEKLSDPRDMAPVTAFYEWLIYHHRPSKKARPLAETYDTSALSPAEKEVIRARVQAVPSLYRVESADRRGTVVLTDALFGDRVSILDFNLSQTAKPGHVLALKVFPLGAANYAYFAGPGLQAHEALPAVEWLIKQGLRLDRESAGKNAHLFGWLFGWLDQQSGKEPSLTNDDGDPLVFREAVYSLQDPSAVRESLRRRKDLELEGDDIFLRPKQAQRGFARIVNTATLTLRDRELVLEVNSDRRLAAVREWLDKIPGVRFKSVSRKTGEQMIAEAGGRKRGGFLSLMIDHYLIQDDREDMFEYYYQRWLDQPIPALGGKSPREACRTAPGKAKTAVLIRLMPDSGENGEIKAPREKLLKTLGIE